MRSSSPAATGTSFAPQAPNRRHGKTIHLRISTDPMVIPLIDFIVGPPEWLFRKGLPYMVREEVGVNIKFPDYRHPLYFQHLERFMKAFANHFKDNPAVELIDLRGYGTWGEWHSGHDIETLDERRAVLKRIIDAWVQPFDGKKMFALSNSYEWREEIKPHGISINQQPKPSYEQFVKASAFDLAFADKNISLRRDGIAHDEALSFHSNYIMTMGWDIVGFDVTRNPGADSALYFYNKESDRLIQKGLKGMGYRFVVTQAHFPRQLRPGARFTLVHSWENRASGRLYRKYGLQVYLMQGDSIVWSTMDPSVDLTNVISGETYTYHSDFDLPESIPDGEYELRLALVDGAGKPAIRLAIEGGDDDLRYRLGQVRVERGEGGQIIGDQPLMMDRSRLDLEAGGTYVIHFRYEPLKQPGGTISEPGHYYFVARTPSGGSGFDRGFTSRLDEEGGTTANKSVVVTLGPYSDYELVWGSRPSGSLQISGVRVMRVPDDFRWYEDFSGGNLDATAYYSPERTTRPAGKSGVRAQRAFNPMQYQDDDHIILSSRPEKLRLEPNASYTISFTVRQLTRRGYGNYFYALVHSDQAGPDGDVGYTRWLDMNDGKTRRKTFTMTTGNYPDYRILFGVHNGGGYVLDEITIVKNGTSTRE